eukprot:1463167-Prorocentrum_lima.AAC.1
MAYMCSPPASMLEGKQPIWNQTASSTCAEHKKGKADITRQKHQACAQGDITRQISQGRDYLGRYHKAGITRQGKYHKAETT